MNTKVLTKKIMIILLLITLFYCSCCTNFVSAVTSFTVELSALSTDVAVGDEVTITVDLKDFLEGETGINSFFGKIDYDQEIFETLAVEDFNGCNGWSGIQFNPENSEFTLTNDVFIHKDGSLLEVTLKVKDTLEYSEKLSTTTVTLERMEASDAISDIYPKDASIDLNIIFPVGPGMDEATSFNVELSTPNQNVALGEEVTITVRLKDFEEGKLGINTFTGKIEYDQEIFETLTEENFMALDGWSSVTYGGSNQFITDNSMFVDTDSDLMKITFKVKDTLEYNENLSPTTITIKEMLVSDAVNDIYPKDVSIDLNIVEEEIPAEEAALKVELAPSNTEIGKGDEVKITVNLKDFAPGVFGIYYFQGTLAYDNEIFEELTIDNFVNWMFGTFDFNPVTNQFAITTTEMMNGDSTIFDVTLKVRDNVEITNESLITSIMINDAWATNNINEYPLENSGIDLHIMEDVELANKVEIYTLQEPEVEVGEEVGVLVDINNITSGIHAILATIEYDQTIFEPLTAESFTVVNGYEGLAYNPTTNTFTVTNSKFMSEDHTVLNIVFKVRDSLQAAIVGDEMPTTKISLKKTIMSDGVNDIYPANSNMQLSIDLFGELDLKDYVLQTFGDDQFLTQITLNTTVNDLKNNITTKQQIMIFNQSNEEITEGDKIGTGMIVKIGDAEEYIMIVTADLSGDGNITALDLSKMKLHIVNTKPLDKPYELAADMNENGTITAVDLSQLQNIIVGNVK